MQVTRLKSIKHALTEKLNNHPLSTANTSVIGSENNQRNPPAPRPKAEGRWATTPKVRIARVRPTPAAGASSALTLLTRVSNPQATVAFANPLALSRLIHLLNLQGFSPQ